MPDQTDANSQTTPAIEAIAFRVTVPAPRADAVADALWDLQPDGVQEEDAGTLGANTETGSAQLVLYVPVGRAADFADQLGDKLEALGLPRKWEREEIPAQDWNAAWKAHYEPLNIGPRLRVVPSWHTEEAAADAHIGERVVVRIDPGQAFGTGTHETTRLVAELLQDIALPQDEILDIGTGSGLLAIAAVLLGGRSASGVDNDPDAIESARNNVQLNGVQAAVAMHVAESPSALAAGTHKLVMVNIISSVLLQLRDAIIERVAPGGTLLLSGVMATEEEAFLRNFLPAGWTVVARRTAAEWIGVQIQAPA